MRRERENRTTTLLILSPFFTVFPALLLVLGAMSDTVQRWCLKESSAAGILGACRTWCGLMFGAVVLGVVLTLAVSVIASKAVWKRGGNMMDLLKIASLPLMVEVILCGLLLKSEVLPLAQRVGPDLQQIRSGQLESCEVWFLPGSAPAHLPGMFGPEKDLVQYQVRDVPGKQFTVYLPASLDFAPEASYQISRDEAWNLEHTPQYRIDFTSCFGLMPEVPERVP